MKLKELYKYKDDAELWLQFRESNEEAFSELMRRYYRMLIHYGLKFTSDRQTLEDALQELMIKLWLQRNNINDTPSVKFYLMKSFRHQIFLAFRKQQDFTVLSEEVDAYYTDSSYEDIYIQQENDLIFSNQVKDILTQLPPRQREVIFLRFFHGLSLEEISSLLSINPQSVSNIVQRSFQKLRSIWPENNILPSIIILFYQTFCYY